MDKRQVALGAIEKEELQEAFERNLSHARRQEQPNDVDADVWDRYEAGRPWVLLNVGIMGLLLERGETAAVLARASQLFHDRGSSYWLVAELLLGRGGLDRETAFGRDLVSTALDAVAVTVSAKRGLRDSRPSQGPGLAVEAVSLLFCAIGSNAVREGIAPYDVSDGTDSSSSVLDALAKSIRSSDREVDRRLASLRAIAGRRFSDEKNLASVRSLIWGAVGAATVAEQERDKGYALMGVEPVLDPVTLAAAMLVLREGRLSGKAMARGGELDPSGSRRPRGLDNSVDVESAWGAYRQYVDVLKQASFST